MPGSGSAFHFACQGQPADPVFSVGHLMLMIRVPPPKSRTRTERRGSDRPARQMQDAAGDSCKRSDWVPELGSNRHRPRCVNWQSDKVYKKAAVDPEFPLWVLLPLAVQLYGQVNSCRTADPLAHHRLFLLVTKETNYSPASLAQKRRPPS